MVYGKSVLKELKTPRVIFPVLPRLFLKYFPSILSQEGQDSPGNTGIFHLGFFRSPEEEEYRDPSSLEQAEYVDCFLFKPLRDRNLDKNLMMIENDYSDPDDFNNQFKNLLDVIQRLGHLPANSEVKKIVNLSALMDGERESLLGNLGLISQLKVKISLIRYSNDLSLVSIIGVRNTFLPAYEKEFFKRTIENKRSPILSIMMTSPGIILQISMQV